MLQCTKKKISAELTKAKLPLFGTKPIVMKKDMGLQGKNDITPKDIANAEKKHAHGQR